MNVPVHPLQQHHLVPRHQVEHPVISKLGGGAVGALNLIRFKNK